MSGCEGCSKRSHGVGKTGLVQRDHIHITLAQKEIRLPRCPCPVQSIQVSALIKHRRLRRIQILWLCIPHNTPSEADHPAVHVHDRKNDPVPELVINTFFLIRIDQTCLTDQFLAIPFSPQIIIKVVTEYIRIPEAECLDRIIRQPSVFQISQSFPATVRFQLYVIISGGFFVHLQDRSLEVCFFLCLF